MAKSQMKECNNGQSATAGPSYYLPGNVVEDCKGSYYLLGPRIELMRTRAKSAAKSAAAAVEFHAIELSKLVDNDAINSSTPFLPHEYSGLNELLVPRHPKYNKRIVPHDVCKHE